LGSGSDCRFGQRIGTGSRRQAYRPVIALPSREPLTPPQHFLTEVVKGAMTPDWWNVRDKQRDVQPISASALIAHQISHVSSSATDGLEFIAGGSLPRTGPLPASRVDRSIVCGVFSVSSDEEGGFENDTLSILYDPSQPAGAVDPEDNTPDGFFGSLLSIPLLERNSASDQVISNSKISTISDALTQAPASAAVPADACSISVTGQALSFGERPTAWLSVARNAPGS
jgi:hypothetical protein